jgi:flagellar hook-associated protein 1 FlgK
MTNIYGLLNIGQSALLTQQKAIDITGNNIANVNTPGYSRQRLVIRQNSPIRVDGQTMSTGVSADSRIQRYYDQFISAQLSAETQDLGRWEAQEEALKKVELMFDESGDYGLSSAMSEFFNAWQDLANKPSGVAERTTLISSSQFLAESFNTASSSLDQLKSDIDRHVEDIVGQVNDIADRIAQLNLKITEIEVTGYNANDFRDERDQLVFELSQLIEINSFEDGDGNLSVSVGNGKPLVEGTSTWDLVASDNGGVQDVYWEGSDGTLDDITTEIGSGELKGWIYARDDLVTGYETQLDELANTLRTAVNGLHADTASPAIDLNGDPGLEFFTGTGASDLALNPAIAADTDLIAAAAQGEGLPGGNGTALAIAELQNAATMSGGSTFSEYYSSLVGQVGADVQSASFNYGHQNTMVQNLENSRQEVSGVSLDEEMVNLVQFQHAYNAAARLITSADEMLDTLMSIAG